MLTVWGINVFATYTFKKLINSHFLNNWYSIYGNPFDPLTQGGNYWDDYTGQDNFSDQNQNNPGPDGIGDTPYLIDGGDNFAPYPFMQPNAWYQHLDLKVFLEGPFNGNDMNTLLNTTGNLPEDQPYDHFPWSYFGQEYFDTISSDDITDWILIELRETSTPDPATATSSTVISRLAAFVLKDGSVVGLDGVSLLNITVPVNDYLFAVVWHRNHLGIMSASKLEENNGVYSFDFTTGAGQVYGGTNGYKELTTGVWGMVAADGNANGQIGNEDKNAVWVPQSGSGGYLSGDFNMDTQVDNWDKNVIWFINSGKGSQVPDGGSNNYSCQVPE